jgi:hypothetical protein
MKDRKKAVDSWKKKRDRRKHAEGERNNGSTTQVYYHNIN